MTTDASMAVALDAEAEAVAILKKEGLGTTKLTSTEPDVFRMATIYHAYDGRSIKVPVYMVDPSEGDSLLKRVFTKDDKDAPPEYIGKRVWYLQEQPNLRPIGTNLCPFSYYNTPEAKAALLEEGFESNCRNKTKFLTKYEVENHVLKRHPKRHAARAKFDLEKNADKQAATTASTNEALMVLIRELASKQEKPAQKKVTD